MSFTTSDERPMKHSIHFWW